MKTIKVDKVVLYYMDRVDPDGNLYRFYMYKGMASEIEYFCTEEAGNMTIPIGEGKYVKIVPKEIERIPVRGYRKLAGIWNCETCNGKGWYRLFNYFKYKPTLCYFKKAGIIKQYLSEYEYLLTKEKKCDFKPFDQVLVRASNLGNWNLHLFARVREEEYKYECLGGLRYKECIPYQGNEHLLGTNKSK